MLTPERYWRVPATFDEDAVPAKDFELPSEIAGQGRPPKVGDGLIIAAYCDETDTGFFRWVGTAISGGGARLQVQWRELDERIWVRARTPLLICAPFPMATRATEKSNRPRWQSGFRPSLRGGQPTARAR